MTKKISESVTEFAKKFGMEDLTKFENDAEVLNEVFVSLDENVKALVSEGVKEKVKEYEEIILALEDQLNEYSNSETTSEATFSEWQKYDPKGLKSMKLNDPERYNKIPGRH